MAKHCERIRTALGLHPQLAHERHSELSLFDVMLSETAYVGEIGLDGSTDFRKHAKIQRQVFRHILESCSSIGGRVLSIHSRGAATQVLDELMIAPNAGVPILHWFTGTHEELNRAVSMGCWFSVGPAMVRSKRGAERASRIPRNRILLESDGPFAKINKLPLEPRDVASTSDFLAQAWNVSNSEIEEQLRSNLHDIGSLAAQSLDVRT